MRIKPPNPKRILIVRTDRIGDVILSTPVIKNLRENFPKSYIAFMCRPYTKDILVGNPYLDEVIVYDKYGRDKSWLNSIRFSFYLRRKRFDWAIILHPTNRAHLITFFAGIPFRVGWDKKLSFLLSKRLPCIKDEGKKHELEYSLDILRTIGVKIYSSEVFIPFYESSEKWVADFLKEHNLDNKKQRIIALGIGASCPSKIWPASYFASLAKLLKDNLDAKILVIAQEKEKYLTQSFQEEFKEFFYDLTGKLDLPKIFSLFRRLSLFIGNDSGLIHIAWALKKPVISLFGRNDSGLSPQRWKPLGENSSYIHKDVGCKVCLAHNCQKGFLCLKMIKPQEVFSLAKKLIC